MTKTRTSIIVVVAVMAVMVSVLALLQLAKTARAEGLESFSEALSVLYVTHRHRLCIDFGVDGWDAAVSVPMARVWRGLRVAGITAGVPCVTPRNQSHTSSVVRLQDVVSLSMRKDTATSAIATVVPGAHKVLLLFAAATPNTPNSVDDAVAAGRPVRIDVADDITARLVRDMQWVADWGDGISVVRLAPRGTAPLADVLETVSLLRPPAPTGTAPLHCVAMWISPDNDLAFSDAPLLRGSHLTLLAYDACFDGPDGQVARARLRRRRPLMDITVVDTQELLPVSSRGTAAARRLLTCLTSPVVLYIPPSAARTADENPLISVLVRRTASMSASGADGAADVRSAQRESLAHNTACSLFFPLVPSTAAWMSDMTAELTGDMIDSGAAGVGDTYSMYDTNGGPLEAASIPRRAVLEQYSGVEDERAPRAHLVPTGSVSGYLVSVEPGRRVFSTTSAWIGGVKLRPGDHVHLSRQKDRREDGKYVVLRGTGCTGGTGVRMSSAALGSYVTPSDDTEGNGAQTDPDVEQRLGGRKQGRKQGRMQGADGQEMAGAQRVHDPESDLLDIGDAVWLSNVSRVGTWAGGGRILMQDSHGTGDGTDGTDGADQGVVRKYAALARCVTDNRVMIKEQCEALEGGSGVWDRPCETDLDCPFFRANRNYRNNRGGCDVAGSGYCEMPLGVKQLSYRKYDRGPASRPICYGCPGEDPVKQDACCLEQDLQKSLPSPDYAFEGDMRQLAPLH